MREDYQKRYKRAYALKKKIVTFPLDIPFYDELSRRSMLTNITVNSYAKTIVTTYLNNEKPLVLNPYQQEKISEYIRISRGIANNFNQMAHNSNMGFGVDINMLLQTLKTYEDNFSELIKSLSDDYQIH